MNAQEKRGQLDGVWCACNESTCRSVIRVGLPDIAPYKAELYVDKPGASILIYLDVTEINALIAKLTEVRDQIQHR